MDVTIVSPLHGSGTHMPRAHRRDGACNFRAEQRNRCTDYPDVEASPHAQLLCLGVETYGRWSNHSLSLIRQLAAHKSKHYPRYLCKSIEYSSHARWWNMLSVGVQRVVSDSIIKSGGTDLIEAADNERHIHVEELLDFGRDER